MQQNTEKRIHELEDLEKSNLELLLNISKNHNALKINPENKNMDEINKEY